MEHNKRKKILHHIYVKTFWIYDGLRMFLRYQKKKKKA